VRQIDGDRHVGGVVHMRVLTLLEVAIST
jgi:hypothetical protein